MEIKQLKITDPEYPDILKEINDPPKLLYYRGNLDALKKQPAIAIVGTRRCSEYGTKAAEKITSGLAKAGVVIVSGMARGIDSCAHKTALEYGAPTIAVLGSGIDDASIYPQTNKTLAHKIIEAGGIVMSEYSPGTPGMKHRFPERNRIVAGLSAGTVAVEAPLKSGTMITTRLALDYNRDVYAVPGSIFSRLSKGSNELISRGAKCARSADDILEDIEMNYTMEFDKPQKSTEKLNAEELKVFAAISEASEAIHVDKIIQNTKLSSSAVFQATASLVIQDFIKEAEPSHYIASR